MFEIKNQDKMYSTFVIGRRYINCAELNVNDFITFIKNDINDAINTYATVSIPKAIEYLTKIYNASRDAICARVKNDAIKFANKKWKTEKKRMAYIEQAVKEINDKYENYNPNVDNISFFDFDPYCGTHMGISSCCILHLNNLTDEQLINCFNELKKSPYFNKAIGWEFEYDGHTNNYMYSFRPSINLIFNKEETKEINKKAENLFNAVNNFYSNSNYWGD